MSNFVAISIFQTEKHLEAPICGNKKNNGFNALNPVFCNTFKSQNLQNKKNKLMKPQPDLKNYIGFFTDPRMKNTALNYLLNKEDLS